MRSRPYRGRCNLHGPKMFFLPIKSTSESHCLQCLNDGEFEERVLDEARESYPAYFSGLTLEEAAELNKILATVRTEMVTPCPPGASRVEVRVGNGPWHGDVYLTPEQVEKAKEITELSDQADALEMLAVAMLDEFLDPEEMGTYIDKMAALA